MEQVAGVEVDLFAGDLPSMGEIEALSEFVNSSESNQLILAEQVDENMSKTSAMVNLATGVGLFMLNRNTEAAEKLLKAKDCKEKFIYLAFALRRLGNFDEAIESLDKSLQFDADKLMVTLEKAATFRYAGDLKACEAELKNCANFKNVNAEYHYQLARKLEAEGLYKQAIENFKTVIELSPEHRKGLFHLAYRYDLSGDDDAAIDYYKQLASMSPTYVNAMINLTVLYEDMGKFEKAAKYVNKVLESHPNHGRANMLKKDIESSKTMFYDEEKEKKKTYKTQILETPISDFELSVRSRNCLRKMRIRTVGDLLNITEAELLSYKNFGETSLQEIKVILDSKGLYLGMAIEEEQMPVISISGELIAEDDSLLNKPVDDLQLSVRARKCLQNLSLTTIGELTRKAEAELLGCKNFGVTSLNEIKKALENIGLSLRSLD